MTVCSLLTDISHSHYLLFSRPLSSALYFCHHFTNQLSNMVVVEVSRSSGLRRHDLPFSWFCLLSSFSSHGNQKKKILCSFSCDYLYCSTLLTSQWCVYFHFFFCTRKGNITSPSSLCWDINLRLWVMSHCLAAGCTTAQHNKLCFISHTCIKT